MHTTKSDILALLKRSDSATVDDIARSVGLAPMTVRQHLATLERDNLVRAESVRRPTGRPHYAYRLTADGHRSIGHGHDRLLALLVDAAGRLNGSALATEEDRRRRLFEDAARHLASSIERRSATSASNLEHVASLLREHGGFPEWQERTDGAFELRDYSCAFRATVAQEGPCAWHETLIAGALGVEPRTLDAPAGCAACCSYSITIPAASAAVNRGTT